MNDDMPTGVKIFFSGVLTGLVLAFLLSSFNGLHYLCCPTFGGGTQCWFDSGPGLFVPGWSQDTRDSFTKQCREYPYHAYFSFMEP